MPLSRKNIPETPRLAEEEVPVPPFGGDVLVRGMLLSQKLANEAAVRLARVPQEGESEGDARARALSVQIPRVLHLCVVDPDGTPLFSQAEWDAFGSVHAEDAYRLFNVAMRLSGQSLEETEKN